MDIDNVIQFLFGLETSFNLRDDCGGVKMESDIFDGDNFYINFYANDGRSRGKADRLAFKYANGILENLERSAGCKLGYSTFYWNEERHESEAYEDYDLVQLHFYKDRR